jgi:hypothetical protein
LSRVMLNVRGADAVEKSGRQHGAHRHGEVHAGPARSETPCTPGHYPHGNREVPGLPGAVAPAAAARLRPQSADARSREVRPAHSTREAAEQIRATGRGGRGGKGRGSVSLVSEGQ